MNILKVLDELDKIVEERIALTLELLRYYKLTNDAHYYRKNAGGCWFDSYKFIDLIDEMVPETFTRFAGFGFLSRDGEDGNIIQNYSDNFMDYFNEEEIEWFECGENKGWKLFYEDKKLNDLFFVVFKRISEFMHVVPHDSHSKLKKLLKEVKDIQEYINENV